MAEFRNLRRRTVSQAGKRRFARGAAGFLLVLVLAAAAFTAEDRPLVPDSLLRAILSELSVETALKETAAVAAHARYPNSQGFFDAAEYVAGRAREYGLQNVRVERFAQKEPMWDEMEAQLSVTAPVQLQVATILAQYSADGDLTAQVADSSSKDLRGKIVLSSAEPEEAWRTLAARGPAAVVSAASGEFFGRHTPPEAILWSTVARDRIALMISPRSAAALRALLQRGPVTVHLHAKAKRAMPGAIGMVMGEIGGRESGHDIVVAAHLDHQKPGANDNASGSGTLLELVRTANRLIAAGKIAQPRRTIRFWWTTEIVSEEAYFRQHPEDAGHTLLAVVLDQAGGERDAENNLIAIRNPEWLPSFADDLIENLAEYVKDRYAPAEHEPDSLLLAGGGSHQSLRTVYWDYQPITDEAAFETRELKIPGIALAVPSLDLIHSNLDTADRLDPTWMKRTALLTLAPVLYLADAGRPEAQATLEYVYRRSAERLARSADPVHDLEMEHERLDTVKALDPRVDEAGYYQRLASVARSLAAGR